MKSVSDELKELVNIAAQSSTRCRLVVSVIVTASILTFIAWYNSLQSSWANKRYQVANDALIFWPLKDEPNADIVPDGKKRFELAKEFADVHFGYRYSESTNGTIALATNFVASVQKRIEVIRESYDRIRHEQVQTIHVAALGISFDVNDLGAISGLAFITLLAALAYSLRRAEENMTYLFHEAKEVDDYPGITNESKTKNIKYCYVHLAAQQVLTVPQMPGSEAPSRLMRLVRVYLLIPVLLQMAIAWADSYNYRLNMEISGPRTLCAVVLAWVAFLAILLLSIYCFHRQQRIDAEWKRAWKEFNP